LTTVSQAADPKTLRDQKRLNIQKYPLTYRNGISNNNEHATKKTKYPKRYTKL
jgi:hypothetical protein